MSGDFEKNISHRMNGFALTPSPKNWERVAAALPEKRRRRFAIWWAVPLAASLCGIIWLTAGYQKKTANGKITDMARKASVEYGSLKKLTRPVPADTAVSYTAVPNPKASVIKKQNITDKTLDTTKSEFATNQPGKKKLYLQPVKLNPQRKNDAALTENFLQKTYTELSGKQVENIAYKLDNAIGNIQLQKPVNTDSIFLNKQPILPLVNPAIIPAPETVAKIDTTLSKYTDTLLKNTVERKVSEKKHKNKKREWSLMIAIGKSSLVDGSSNSRKSIAGRNLYNSGGLTSGGQVRDTGTFSKPTGGINFIAGITRSQMLSKHVSWQAGISYQLLTTKQRIGSRNDSLEKADASTDVAFYPANRTGNAAGQPPSTSSSNSSNKVHRLQIASGLDYTLNPKTRSPIRFSAGASIAYNISNNLLLHDYRSYSYIRSAKLSNKCMLGGEAGIDVFVNQRVHAGIFYQHDFTNVAKPEVGSVFRWNQLQLRISIPVLKY